MNGSIIFLSIVLMLLYLVMLSIMVVFERDKPKRIIIWAIIFLILQPIGYIIYLIQRLIINDKKNQLASKELNDSIYKSLVSSKFLANDIKSDDEIFCFNKRAFNAKIRNNTHVELISDYFKLKESVIKDCKQARNFIYMELTSINPKDFEPILEALIDAKKRGLDVRICLDKKLPLGLKKRLLNEKIKIRQFSKINPCDGAYSNLRNVVVIDGAVAYVANFNIKSKVLNSSFDVADSFIKLKGDIVEDITLNLCQDLMFSTGKHIDFSLSERTNNDSSSTFQYITNSINDKIELVLVKAICSAKKSICLELDTFVPSESILQLLKYAIDSNIMVNLMVPIKSTNMSKYYASRAYAKELALMGANVYLYDGYIRFNSIIVDEHYAIVGGYTIDRVNIAGAIQNALVTDDSKTLNYYKRLFDSHINNSYKINDAKFMLLKEKIFKNFV